ncbi:MAG: hypothetical protein RSE09_05800 [Oscillospiraceae bacterium]
MTVLDLQKALQLQAFSLPDPTRQVTGGYCGDLLSWVMGRAQQGDGWVTIMSSRNVAAVASLTDVSCVILAEDVRPDADLAEVCTDKGINLLGGMDGTFALSVKLGELLK